MRAPHGLALGRVAAGERFSVPPSRAGLIERPGLVARFERAATSRILVVCAGAGYGKTCGVAEWARQQARPVAWLTVDRRDNDPARLHHELWRAVSAACEADAGTGVPPEPRELLWSAPIASLVLVIDDVHALVRPAARHLVDDVLSGVDERRQVVLVGRCMTGLRMARYRVDGRLAEVGPRHCSMSVLEADAVLRARRKRLPMHEVQRLHERTEGWPAGVGLAAADEDITTTIGDFDGTRPAVADYFREEVLPWLGTETSDFLTWAATLDVLSGPACDAVLEMSDSGRRLAELAKEGSFLVPLAPGDRYRLHTLFGQYLRQGLHDSDRPGAVRLHRRASRWYQCQGTVTDAVRQALLARDYDRAGVLVLEELPDLAAAGWLHPVWERLQLLPDELVGAHAPLALARAWMEFVHGDHGSAERWATVVDAHGEPSTPALAQALSMLTLCLGTRDLVEVASRARWVREQGPIDSRWYPLACLCEGSSRLLLNDREEASALLHEAASRSAHLPAVRSESFVELALLAADEERWGEAEQLVDAALSAAPSDGVSGRPTVLALAAAAYVAAQGKRLIAARQLAGRARVLMEEPVATTRRSRIQALLALSETKRIMGEIPVVQTLLSEAEAQLAPGDADGAFLRDQFERLSKESANITAGEPALGLTCAEMRVLALLPTHLSLREIAATVHLSRNTVKTQAIAVYRKLGVSARSPAVERARELGLLDPNGRTIGREG